MEEIAYAKINLALHVRARKADGYHDIETLFAFADDGDRLAAQPSDALTLAVRGPFAAALDDAEDNLVLRAARRLRERCHVREGAALTLAKHLPVAAGIGGGSADAAAALRLLARLWGLDRAGPVLMEIAAELGADVPACLASETVRGTGRGDMLTPVDGAELTGAHLLLVNPGVALMTAPVFQGWDGVDRGDLAEGAPLQVALAGRNDLEPAACTLAPVIQAVLKRLAAQPGIILARMSGSGATCFGLFSGAVDRDAAAAAIRAEHPDWWCFPARLR
jgi:4-diphosphocytidyl-2-C-methyl-D-erythritol kinase